MESNVFDLPQGEAFELLGARNPVRHWSGFDVPRNEARQGKASLFVTTIWNWRHKPGANGVRIPTKIAIVQNTGDGSYWYRMDRAEKGKSSPTHIAHWEGINLAFEKGIPITGVYKDVKTGRCSSHLMFDIPECRETSDGIRLWVKLIPRSSVEFEFELRDLSDEIGMSGELPSLLGFENEFARNVQRSRELTPDARRQRLETASTKPRRILVTTHAFVRNPDVVAEVLLRTNGRCESCGCDAPFIRKSDGTPYLEVHHKITLADGGEDTVENAEALCPNCHRAKHYA
jgi:5-methylcytosine-specific restriction endonuclease McrA